MNILSVYTVSKLQKLYESKIEYDNNLVYVDLNKIKKNSLNVNYLGTKSYTYTYKSAPNNDYFVLLLQKLGIMFPDSIITYALYTNPTFFTKYIQNTTITYTPSITPITNFISVNWNQVQYVIGMFTFNYELVGVNETDALSKLPFLFLSGTFEKYGQPDVTISGSSATVTVNTIFYLYSSVVNYADFGLTFNFVMNYYYSASTINITKIQNIPFSKSGYQFNSSIHYPDYNSSNGSYIVPSLFITPGENPIILPNTSFYSMFKKLIFNSDISGWNTSNVTDMSYMFYYVKTFNQPIGSWNTSNVLQMIGMFNTASEFDQPIGSWNTSNVINMIAMFYYAVRFNQDLSNWNTNKVTDISYIFNYAEKFNNGDIPGGTSKKMLWTFNTTPIQTNWTTGSALTPENAPASLTY